MKNISTFASPADSKIKYFLTDIDDTMSTDGMLTPEAYRAIWKLYESGIKVIPVTGRPAGWCEMIARFWPIAAVVGENGGFYFSYAHQKMTRWFSQSENERLENNKKLEMIKRDISTQLPQVRIASDQFCRLIDLAIDFNEDVKGISRADIQKIVHIFIQHGATAKVSSIHVNGWYGNHSKVSTAIQLLKKMYGLSDEEIKTQCVYAGDSPNDEPMFEFFPLSFGVANVMHFKNEMTHFPRFITNYESGQGFCEIVDELLKKI